MPYNSQKSSIFRGVDYVWMIPMDAVSLVRQLSRAVFPFAAIFWAVPKTVALLPIKMTGTAAAWNAAAAGNSDLLLGLALVALSLVMISDLILGFVHQRLMRMGKTLESGFDANANYLEYLDFEAAKIVKSTLRQTGAPFPAMLLLNITKTRRLGFTFRRLCIERLDFEKTVLAALKARLADNSPAAKAVLEQENKNLIESVLAGAVRLASGHGEKKVSIFMLFLALMDVEPSFRKVLDKNQLLEEDIESTVVWQMRVESYRKWRGRYWEVDNLQQVLASSPVTDLVGGYTVTLDLFSHDLSYYNPLRQGGVILHQKEIEELEDALSKQNGNGVLLVGEIGSGRKSIVYNFANRMASETSFGDLKMMRIMELDMVALIGNHPDRASLSAVLEKIFTEAVKAENVVLIIPQVHNYIGQQFGAEKLAAVDISGVISRFLKIPGFRVIGITTYEGLHRSIERAGEAASLFCKIEVAPPSMEDAIRVLKEESLRRERKSGLFIPIITLKEIVKLCDYFLGDQAFPAKAVNLLDELVANKLSHSGKSRSVMPGEVDTFFSHKYDVPAGAAGSKEKEILLNLEDRIHEGLINQKEAVEELANALRRARAEIKKRKRTIGNFLFLGPTGVGKTETAKQLARVYFGSVKSMIRLNMAEYQTVESIEKLIGSPANPGVLTTAVRENPFSLVLIDEIEKADPGLLNIFLSVFDEGELTDGYGRNVDFRHTIIIATSNAGAEYIKEAVDRGSSMHNFKDTFLDNLMRRNIFKPEFLNRFDAAVLYRPLTAPEMQQVAALMIKDIKDGLREKRIELVLTEELMQKLGQLGFDPAFGGRAMRRAVQDKIENAVARAVLSGRVKSGDVCEFDCEKWELLVGDERKAYHERKTVETEADDPLANVLLKLEDRIHEGLVDQEEAVKELANALRRAHVDIKERKRTIGNFLFLGPTGCGKTETAKQLARVYFGSVNNMIRLNMAEYQTVGSIEKIIGSLDSPGLLTTQVIENPNSIILIDEIEKAIPQVLNIFLSVFDEGMLSDGTGRAVDFKNTIIIATSNAGAEYIKEAVEKGSRLGGEFKRIFIDNLLHRGVFNPEFLNRFDAVALYRPLGSREMRLVAGLMLKDIQNGLALKGIDFRVGDALVEKLVQIGFDPVFGGRELRRAVQNNVENAIANSLLSRSIRRGDIVEIDPYTWQAVVAGKVEAK